MKSILIITLCVLVCLASAKPKGPSVVSISPQPDSSEETHTSGLPQPDSSEETRTSGSPQPDSSEETHTSVSSAPLTSSGAPNPSAAQQKKSGSRH